jgi:hypothetical protein
MMKKDRELIELRQKTLSLNDKLSKIAQFSWRLKKIKDFYGFDSGNLSEMQFFYEELYQLWTEFKLLMRREVEDENT